MKKVLALLIVFNWIISACDEPEIAICDDCEFTCFDDDKEGVFTNACKDNYECIFKILPKSKVSVDEYEGYELGKKTVFQMITSTEGSPMIADDEFVTFLVWDIDPDLTSFSVSDEELSELNVHLKTVCFCADVKFNAPEKGCIQGLKQPDGSWLIQGKLLFLASSGAPFKFSARFVG